MDPGTYQVVSEHSILSAQKKIRDAAMEFLEEESFNSVPEWKVSLREVKNHWDRREKGVRRRSQRDHAPCRRRRKNDELSKKDYEIYLDQKLQMLQQFYVTEKPRKPNEGYIEPEAAKSETGESEKEDKETADCVSLPSPALVPKQIGNTKVECRFSEDIVDVHITIPNVADTTQKASMHHRDVELTLAEKTCTIDEPERCRRDATGQIRSDLRECESLIFKTGKSVACKFHALSPEPPEPPDRGLSTAEVFELVSMNNRVHQNLIINSTQLNNERRVSEEESEMENLKVSFPTIIEHKCSFLLDCGEVREARDGRIFCYCFELLLNRVGKIIKLLVGVGGRCGHGLAQLINILIMVESPFGHEWDPGGFKRKGWDPSGFKSEETDDTCAMECKGSRAYYYPQVFLNFQQILNFIGYYGGDSMGSEKMKTIYAITRLEVLFIATFLLFVKEGNGRGKDYVFVQFGHTLKVQYTLRVEADKAQNIRKGRLQPIINSIGDCGDVFMSSKMPESPNFKAAQFNNEERCLQEARGIENGKHNPCALVLGALRKILKFQGTSMLPQFIHVHHLIAKKAWVTEVNLLDTHYGGQTVPTPDQLFNIVLPFHKPPGLSIEDRKQSSCTLSFLIDEFGCHQPIVEHLLQESESSSRLRAETHLKQWDPGGNYHFPLMCLIELLGLKLWDPEGAILLLLEDQIAIQEMKIVMIRQVAHEDVEVLNNWNGILLFHNFIFRQVIMLALLVILNCEWGSHKSDDFENITQVWLQTRQEIWVEHLIQELGSPRRPMRETQYNQWDPGEPYLVSCIVGTSCFKLWDPGGRVLIVVFIPSP